MEKKIEMSNTPNNERVGYEIKVQKNTINDNNQVLTREINGLSDLDDLLEVESTGDKYVVSMFSNTNDAKDIWIAFIGLCKDKTKYKEYAKKILQFDRNKKNNSPQALKEIAEEVGITDINIDVENSENVEKALTKISIAQEQKERNEINSSESPKENKVSTVDLKTDFDINVTTIGTDNTNISVSSKEEFIEIFKDGYIGKETYFGNDPKNIREICNMIIHYQATLGKDNNKYKEFIKNFINELNDEKYKKVGCSDIKRQFINEFQRIGKSEGVNIDFRDFGYGVVQYNSYFEVDNIDKLISRLEPLADKISRDIKAKNRTLEEKSNTLDKIGDLLLNFNEKITGNKLDKKSINNFCNSLKSSKEYSLSNEEIDIVKGFISYASNNFIKSEYIEDLGNIIDAKIKEITGEEEYKIYTGESKDAGEGLGNALIESLNGVNRGNRLSYSQDLILKGYRKAIEDIIKMAKKKVNDKSVVGAFNEVLEEMAVEAKKKIKGEEDKRELTEEELKEKEEFLTKRIEEIKGIYTKQIDNIVESDKSDDKKEEDLKNLTSENEDIGVDNKKISKKYRYALAANMKDLEKVKLKKYNYKIERANKIEKLLGKLKEGTLGEDKKELKELLEKEKLNNKEMTRLVELNSKKKELNEQEQKELTELERRDKLGKLSDNINKVTGDAAKIDATGLKGDLEQQKADLEKQKNKSIKDIVGTLKQEAGEIKREYYEARYTKINEEKKIFTENMFGEKYSKKGLSPDDKEKIAESVQDRKTVLGVYNYCLLPFLDFEYNNKTYMNHKGEKQKMARKHNPIADLFWKIQENRRSVINGERMKHSNLEKDSQVIKLQLKEFFTMIPNENLKKINEVLSIDGVKEKINEICSYNGKSLVSEDFKLGDFLKNKVDKKCKDLENSCNRPLT